MQLTTDTQTSDRAWTDTSDLAQRYRLSAYDSAYLELAVRTGSTLATLD
jgi:predicted nucleic acid-binding protein